MKYVNYPGTDKQVSVVGFGGLRFGLDKTDEENADMILYAYDKGINYLVSPSGSFWQKERRTFTSPQKASRRCARQRNWQSLP